MSVVKVTLPGGEIPVNGKQVSFVAPCGCDAVTGLSIEGETYTVVDAMGEVVTGIGGVFCAGSVISVILDTVNKKAYLQNGVTPARVGDTLTTIRTDLGDKWLLCNGEGVNASEYPELSEKLNSRYNFVENSYVNIKGFDGTYYAGFNYNYVPVYSTSPAGPWTPVPRTALRGTFSNAEAKTYGNFRFFDDGYWYCKYGTGFARTKDITSDNWEVSATADPVSGGDFTVINGEIFHIGYWEYYSGGEFYRVGMSRGTIAGGMTLYQFGTVSYLDLHSFVFDGDYAYCVYCREGNSYYGTYYDGVIKFDLTTGKSVKGWNSSYESYSMIDAGEHLIVKGYSSGGTWYLISKSTMELVKSFSVAVPNGNVETVISFDGVGMMQISGSENKFIVYTYPEIGGGYTMQEMVVSFATKVDVTGFSRWNDGTVDSLTGMFINNVTGGSQNGFYRAKALPSISVDGAYTYIKAKE